MEQHSGLPLPRLDVRRFGSAPVEQGSALPLPRLDVRRFGCRA
ncbi:hypothetical protein [Georgenia sp. EYE_87]|nr:hypothetical protein [Georgenia sp. EYE_87]